jgi:hypothetical protein
VRSDRSIWIDPIARASSRGVAFLRRFALARHVQSRQTRNGLLAVSACVAHEY